MKQCLERNTKVHSLMSQVSLLLALVLGLFLTSCVKRATIAPNQHTVTGSNSAELSQSRTERININTAATKDLEKLPGIGRGLAERIVDHREKYGPFRRPEHLIIVRGISDKRFRMLRDLVTVE
jgi:competence ComEA-like helix-hairpin-helix protein